MRGNRLVFVSMIVVFLWLNIYLMVEVFRCVLIVFNIVLEVGMLKFVLYCVGMLGKSVVIMLSG